MSALHCSLLFLTLLFHSTHCFIQPLLLSNPTTASEWHLSIYVRPARIHTLPVSYNSRLFCLTSTDATLFRTNNHATLVNYTHDSNSYTDTAVASIPHSAPYTCFYPAPSIAVSPGETLHLTVSNQLEAESGPSIHNTLHAPNTTNIHLHGVHIDPSLDNVFVRITPAQSHTYHYTLPSDHLPGLHWYHAHHHGSTALQIMAGLFGAFIVLPAQNATASSPSRLPTSYTHARKYIAVISHIQFDVHHEGNMLTQGCNEEYLGGRTAGHPLQKYRSYAIQELGEESGSRLNIDEQFNSSVNGGVNSTYMMVNGAYQPTLNSSVNDGIILQILHSSAIYAINITVVHGSDAPHETQYASGIVRPTLAASCELRLLAMDGVFLNRVRLKRFVIIPPGGRAEVQISCSAAGQYALTGLFGEYQIQPLNDHQRLQTLMYINVNGATATQSANSNSNGAQPANNTASLPLITDTDLASIVRPAYLQDLRAVVGPVPSLDISYAQLGKPNEKQECQFWIGTGSNCNATHLPSKTCTFNFFDGLVGGNGVEPFNESWPYDFVVPVGSAAQFRLYGATAENGRDSHPFHMHTNHFQVVASEAHNYADFYEIGDWRDTIPVLDPGAVTVRFWAADYAGEIPYHCHELRHEDLGMMHSFYICDNRSDPAACPLQTGERAHAGYTAPWSAEPEPQPVPPPSLDEVSEDDDGSFGLGSDLVLVALLFAVGLLLTGSICLWKWNKRHAAYAYHSPPHAGSSIQMTAPDVEPCLSPPSRLPVYSTSG